MERLILGDVTHLVSHPAPFPKRFEFEGKEYRIASSSSNNLADVFTGHSPFGHICYSCDEGGEITVWFALLTDASLKAFFAARGHSMATFDSAMDALSKMVGWGLACPGPER